MDYDVIDPPGTQLATPAPSGALAHQTAVQIKQMVQDIEERAVAIKQLIKAVARFTFEHDWVNMGGKLYLQGSGARRIAEPLGIHLSEPRWEEEWIDGDFFAECTVTATWPRLCAAPVHERGDCSTLDPFYAAIDDEGKVNAGSALGKALAATGQNAGLARRSLRADVRKKAYENAISRAVTGMLGLRGIKPENLKELGFTFTTIDYRKGATKQSAAVAKKASQSVAPEALATIASGSVVDVVGTLESVGTPQKSAKGAAFQYLNFPGKIGVAFWGEGLPEWADAGAPIVCKSVEIKVQGDKRYYNCREIESAEAGGGAE